MTEKYPVRHLAQINVARAIYALDDPGMDDFMAALDTFNALAEAQPGFVWRLQSDSGNATDIRSDGDERLIINMSVWRDIDALFDYAYNSDHITIMRRRREWFEKHDAPALALWWVEVGHTPALEEGLERLEHLRANGPSQQAFTFRDRFQS